MVENSLTYNRTAERAPDQGPRTTPLARDDTFVTPNQLGLEVNGSEGLISTKCTFL
jgi:hypothetical protein